MMIAGQDIADHASQHVIYILFLDIHLQIITAKAQSLKLLSSPCYKSNDRTLYWSETILLGEALNST